MSENPKNSSDSPSENGGSEDNPGEVESVKAQPLKKRSFYEYYSAGSRSSGTSGGTNAPGAGPVGGGARVSIDSEGMCPPLKI